MSESFPYWELLKAGEAGALTEAFLATPVINDPRAGRVVGKAEVDRFVADAARWLEQREASVEQVAVTDGTPLRVTESLLGLSLSTGRWNLPVAVVEDRANGRLREIRVYHTLWPLTGAHRVRPPLLERDPSIELQGAVADYQRALAAGDLDGIMAAYEEDAYAREPSGGPYVFEGRKKLREIYAMQFANGGGIPLQHCTATDDGVRCAIEYSVARWGVTEIPPQAGIAVYERGKSGKLCAGRIYDDVEPPPISDSARAAPASRPAADHTYR